MVQVVVAGHVVIIAHQVVRVVPGADVVHLCQVLDGEIPCPTKKPSPSQQGGYPRGQYFWDVGSLKRGRGHESAPRRVFSDWLRWLWNA